MSSSIGTTVVSAAILEILKMRPSAFDPGGRMFFPALAGVHVENRLYMRREETLRVRF